MISREDFISSDCLKSYVAHLFITAPNNVLIVASESIPSFYLYFQKYLVQFGYMDPHVMRNDSRMTNDMMESMMRTSIMDFQMFVGLQPTGKYNYSFSLT